MRRIISALLVAALLFNVTGCDALRKKFTRKKKEVKKAPRVYQEQKYVKVPSPELYSKHFAYWKSWMMEILQDLGGSRKRDTRCMEEMIGQLNDMKALLVESKAEELDKHIETFERIRGRIVNEELSQYNKSQVQSTLEREDRIIASQFSTKKMKDYIRNYNESMAASTVIAPSDSRNKTK